MVDTPNVGLDAAQNAIVGTSATTYSLSLHTLDPGQTGLHEGTDLRQNITFGSSTNGLQVSTNGQTWTSAQGLQTYQFFGVWTPQGPSGGTFVRGGSISTITPTAGTPITAAPGAITFTAS